MTDTGTPVYSQQLSAPSGSVPVSPGLPFSLGEGAQCGSLWVLPRPRHRGGWEEKVAAVAQSARVSATRDCLPVGQSQLRAPDQALGERTNKCSRARILSLGVNYRRRLRPSALSPPPPSPALRSARSPPCPGPPALGSPAQTPSKLFRPGLEILDSGASPPAPLLSVPSRASPRTRSEQSPLARPSLSLQPFWGGALHARGSSRGSPAPRSPF